MQEAFHVVYIMISAMTKYKLEVHPPDVLIRPNIHTEIDLLIGYHRAEEVIADGEKAAQAALPQILAALQTS